MSTRIKYADRTLFELPSLSLWSDGDSHKERIRTVEEHIFEALESLRTAAHEAARILDESDEPTPGVIHLLPTIVKAQSSLGRASLDCYRLREQDEGHGSAGYPSLENELADAQEILSGERQGYPAIEGEMDMARVSVGEALEYVERHRERHHARIEARRELQERVKGGVWMQRLRTTWRSLFLAALMVDIVALIAVAVGIEAGTTVRQAITNPLFVGLGVVLAFIVVRWVAIRAQHALQE